MNYETYDAWLAALEQAQREQTHWTTEINGPVITRGDGRVGRYDRWGVFHEKAA